MEISNFLNKLGEGSQYYWIDGKAYEKYGTLDLQVDPEGYLNVYRLLDGALVIHNILEQ